MLTINGKQVALDAVIGVTNPPAPVVTPPPTTTADTTNTDTKAAA
jgi:hypothetical protein